MVTNNVIEIVQNLLQPLLTDDLFLVDIKIKPTNNIKIFLDADAGLPIDRCTKINRALYRQMEEMEMFADGNFSLEVSSPGIDAPLKLTRQYVKNIGRNIEVELLEGDKIEGTLTAANDETIAVHSVDGKGKKAVETTREINRDQIKQSIVQIKF